jgi:hypothetical protein
MQFGRVQLTPNLQGIESAFDTETAGLDGISFAQREWTGGRTVYMDSLGLRSWGRICSSLFLCASLLRRQGLDEPNHTVISKCQQKEG